MSRRASTNTKAGNINIDGHKGRTGLIVYTGVAVQTKKCFLHCMRPAAGLGECQLMM